MIVENVEPVRELRYMLTKVDTPLTHNVIGDHQGYEDRQTYALVEQVIHIAIPIKNELQVECRSQTKPNMTNCSDL